MNEWSGMRRGEEREEECDARREGFERRKRRAGLKKLELELEVERLEVRRGLACKASNVERRTSNVGRRPAVCAVEEKM
jgi:hypothetical protein